MDEIYEEYLGIINISQDIERAQDWKESRWIQTIGGEIFILQIKEVSPLERFQVRRNKICKSEAIPKANTETKKTTIS